MRAIKVMNSGVNWSEGNARYSPNYSDRHISNGLYTFNSDSTYGPRSYIGFRAYSPDNYISLPNMVKKQAKELVFVQFSDGAIVQERHFYDGTGTSHNDAYCRKANYNAVNTPGTNDGKGTFGPNGSGEPLTIDGVEYGMKFMGFGKTKADVGTPKDNMTKYVLNSEPAGVVKIEGIKHIVSGDNGWTENANAFQYNVVTGAFLFDSITGNERGWLIGIPKTGLKTVVDVDGLTWDMPNGRYNSTKYFDAPAFTCRVSRGQDASVDLFTASIGGKEVLRKTGVKTSEPVAVDLAEWWKTAADGTYDLVLSAGTGAKKSFDTTVRFSKVSTGIELTGKPADRDKMPTACFVASAVVLGEQATEAWYVCNNANDSNPAWEEYRGGKHVFTNKKKTAAKWAVAWRVVVDNGASTRRSEILKHVGMAVM